MAPDADNRELNFIINKIYINKFLINISCSPTQLLTVYYMDA